MADFAVGSIVVYLDGAYFEVDAVPGVFEGFFAVHELQRLPHFVALKDPTALRATLGAQSYWLERAAPEPSGVH